MGNLLACLGSRGTPKSSPSRKKRYGRYKPVGESPTPRKLASLLTADDSALERSDAGGAGGGGVATDVNLETESRLETEPLRGNVAENSSSCSSPQSDNIYSSPPVSNSPRKKVTFDLNVTTFERVATSRDSLTSAEEGDEVNRSMEGDAKSETEEGSSRVPTTYPANSRYQNCEEISEDEFSEEDITDYSDGEDDIDFHFGTGSTIASHRLQQESYDSYFSLQVDEDHQGSKDFSTNEVSSIPRSNQQEIAERDRTGQDRNNCTLSTLNPLDRKSPWKETKGDETPNLHANKENLGVTKEPKLFFTPEQSIHSTVSLDSAANSYVSARQEFSVDSSLSCWLTAAAKASDLKSYSPENNCRTNYQCSTEDRPILGALTIDDIKQAVSPSPRKSPRSPDETPIVGTVGNFWNPANQEVESGVVRTSTVSKGIPNTTSKYREDKLVSWHSTPFEERLERALRKQQIAEP